MGIANTAIPFSSTDGGSRIIDYRGMVLAEAGAGESMAAYAEIDLEVLRRYRRRPGMFNLLSRQRFELYAESYAKFSIYPPNTLADKPADRAHFMQIQRQAIERLAGLGIIE